MQWERGCVSAVGERVCECSGREGVCVQWERGCVSAVGERVCECSGREGV